MSLQERIKHLARQEVERVLGASPTPDSGGAPTRAQLQQQITDLHEHLHQAATTISRLETRVEALEKAETPAARRTTRKRADA